MLQSGTSPKSKAIYVKIKNNTLQLLLMTKSSSNPKHNNTLPCIHIIKVTALIKYEPTEISSSQKHCS